MSQKYLIPVQNVEYLCITCKILSSNTDLQFSVDTQILLRINRFSLESFNNHSAMPDLSRESVQYVCTRFRSPNIARRYGHKIYSDYQENRDNNAFLTSDWS